MWDQVAKSLHALAPSVNIVVGKIDGTKHVALMREMRADRFPALVFVHMNLQKRDPPELGITVYKGEAVFVCSPNRTSNTQVTEE